MITSCVGFTRGSHYLAKGFAVEPLCLSRDPEWGMYIEGQDGLESYIHGAKYMYKTDSFRGNMKTVHNHDVPRAVCLIRQRQ